MAIDTWATLIVDPGASKKPDAADHFHRVSRQTANANDVVLAFDRTKVGSRTILRSAVAALLKALEGGNELTA